VLITGASGTIGHALAVRFARSGWKLGLHWHTRSKEAHATARAAKEQGADVSLHQADIRQASAVDQMMQRFLDTWGSLDLLICNAGTATSALVVKTEAEDWDRVISTNLTGTFLCMKAAATRMEARGHGAIVVIGSYSGLRGSTGQAAYAASKAGLLGLVHTAAREWGSAGIRVNLLLPGRQPSTLAGDAAAPDRQHDHLLGAAPQLSTVAAAAYRLACSRDTSGQVWNVDSRIL
jgi:3-oxoacyl-[acyl-carrier protein] reductase